MVERASALVHPNLLLGPCCRKNQLLSDMSTNLVIHHSQSYMSSQTQFPELIVIGHIITCLGQSVLLL